MNDKISKPAQRLVEVKRRYRDELLSLPNVNGVGAGYKVIAGETTDVLSIRVYVAEKVSLQSLASADDCVPSEVDGAVTDVIGIGKLVPVGYLSKERPALGGASAGDLTNGGTLGARFIDNTDATGVVLSCNHVFSLSDDVARNAAVVDTPIIQPFPGSDPADRVALLKRWVKYELPPTWNKVDGAIAEIIGPLKASACIHDVGRYQGWRSVDASDLGVTVSKVGAVTGLVAGAISDVSWDFTVDMGYGDINFEDQIQVYLADGGFAVGGDSGSMLIDSQSRLLGLVSLSSPLGSGVWTACCPIDAVLSQLDISVCPTC